MENRRRRPGSTVFGTALVVGGVIVAVVVLSPDLELSDFRRAVQVDSSHGVPGSGGDGYAFMQTTSSGRPITWPCDARIPIELNPAGAPDEYRAQVDEAVQIVNDASGFTFEVSGITESRNFFEAGRDTVVIGWADENEVPRLAGDVAGVGGASYLTGPGGAGHSVGGTVVVDTEVPSGWFSRTDPVPVLVHELGHVLGLGHSDDPDALMAAENHGQEDFTQADRDGLAALREAACS